MHRKKESVEERLGQKTGKHPDIHPTRIYSSNKAWSVFL
jgi:hypothetical protein